MIEKPSGVINFIFEEKGINYLIYKLSFDENQFFQEKQMWQEAKSKIINLQQSFELYLNSQDFIKDWDRYEQIKKSYELFKEFYITTIKSELQIISDKYQYSRYKELAPAWNSLVFLLNQKFQSSWGQVQYGVKVKEFFAEFNEIFKHRSFALNSLIDSRIDNFFKFSQLQEKSVVLLAKIYINDWKTENFDVVFSFEEEMSGDLSVFLFHEVYRYLRFDMVHESKSIINQLDQKCCWLFNFMKESSVDKFLCRLDEFLVNYNNIALNKTTFDYYASPILLNFIDKFINTEKIISEKLMLTKEFALKKYAKISLNKVSQVDFIWLVLCDVLSLNTVELISTKDRSEWEFKLNTICQQIEWRLKHDCIETLIKDGNIKIIPWKILSFLNSENAGVFWKKWKQQFLVKQYPLLKNIDSEIILTGKYHKDILGTHEEVVSLYLSGLNWAPQVSDQKCSIEREIIIIQQRSHLGTMDSKLNLGVQFSFVLDRFINSQHKKQFSM